MSDYFDRVEQGMRAAVRRRAHLPWYARLLGAGRAHGPAVVLAALVIATPAVGAVTNWFGIGAPDRFPAQSPTQFAGRALPGTSRLLALRVPDPQGGPPWGLRLVATTRGDTCIQLGRIEGGQIGSLGIDYAWNDDHLFHPFPNTSIGDSCGTTDAAGNGFVNVSYTGMIASANPTSGARGPQGRSCRPLNQGTDNMPLCPPGSTRIVFTGLLGPDATSVTYMAPDGRLATEATSGSDGAYLLVFKRDQATCDLYTRGPFGSYGPCGATEGLGGASPDQIGAIKAIAYRDGHVCRLVPPPQLLAAYKAFVATLRKRFPAPGAAARPALRRAFDAFLAAHHLTHAQLASLLRPICPAVGYVAGKGKRMTAAQVRTPVRVKRLPSQYREFQVDIIFLARQPVTSSRSWYEDFMTNPRGCSSSAQGGEIGFGNIRAGHLIHDRRLIGSCRGTYHGVIGYMANSGPIDQESSGGGMPGRDGSIVVGRFSFTIR